MNHIEFKNSALAKPQPTFGQLLNENRAIIVYTVVILTAVVACFAKVTG